MAVKKGGVRKTARRAYVGLPKRRSGFRASPKLRKTEASLARARSQLRKARAGAKGAQPVLMEAAAVTAGGAAAGAVEAYMPDGIMGIDTSLIAGLGLVAAGVYLNTGSGNVQTAKVTTCLGSGMLAAWAADLTSGMLE